MNKIACLVIILITLISKGAFATPSIDSVNTSQLKSNILTITGTGFGASGAQVIMFDRFESNTANTGDDIPLTSPDIGAWTSDGGYPPRYNTIAHSGKFSAQVFDKGMRQFQLDFGKGIQEIFLSYWVRLPDNQIFPGRDFPGGKLPGTFPDDSSWKFAWLIDRDYQGNSSDVCLPTHIGRGIFWLAGNDFNLDTGIGNSWWSWNSWIRMSVWLRANKSDPKLNGDVLFETVSTDKGLREYYVSRPVFDGDYANASGQIYYGSPNIQQYQKINFPGWIREETDSNTTPLYDDIYVAVGDNSISRVELADSSNYQKAKKVAIQTIRTWSDNQISFDINQGQIGDVSKVPAFIFVWDKDGNRNTVGIPVLANPSPPMIIP